MKTVLYTVVYGKCDFVPKFSCTKPDCDCFIITDQKDLANHLVRVGNIFKPILTPPISDNTRKASRHIKCRPDLIFGDYDASIYLDANLIVKMNIPHRIPTILSKTNYAVCKHPRGISSSYDDGKRCIKERRDDPDVIRKQLDYYKKCGYEEKHKNIPACGLLIRRHNEEEVKKFGEAWWGQILEYSERDQISWPFIRWKMNFKHAWIGDPGLSDLPGDLFKIIERRKHVQRTYSYDITKTPTVIADDESQGFPVADLVKNKFSIITDRSSK